MTLLRRHGAMQPPEMLSYRGDCVAAQVPRKKGLQRSRGCKRALEPHDATQKAYASIGVPDVEEKRQTGALTTVAWGCELQGVRGRAGSPRCRRAALAALTVALCSLGVTTVELLQRIVGLWVDVLLYRRSAFAVLRAAYGFMQRYCDVAPSRVRTLTGPVCTELLGVAALAPLLDAPLRASVHSRIKVSDASPSGVGVISCDLPNAAAAELWRHRVRPSAGSGDGDALLCSGSGATTLWARSSKVACRCPDLRSVSRPDALRISMWVRHMRAVRFGRR